MTTITIDSTHKPQRAATAEAVVTVTGTASWDEVVDAGLAALHEPRADLFGYGIRGTWRGMPIVDRTVTVFATKD